MEFRDMPDTWVDFNGWMQRQICGVFGLPPEALAPTPFDCIREQARHDSEQFAAMLIERREAIQHSIDDHILRQIRFHDWMELDFIPGYYRRRSLLALPVLPEPSVV